MPVDFGATLKKAEEEGLIGGGDYLKFKEGDNRFRLMTECLPHADDFKGQRNFKWLCYVLDKRDGKVKPLFMPHTIYKQIVALQTNEDYAFFDVPMPYELNVHATGAGTKEVKYALIPARKNTDVGPDAMQQLAALKSLPELQAKLKDKKAKQQTEQEPPHNIDERPPLTDEDIPF